MCEIHIFENAKNNSHRVYCDGIGFLMIIDVQKIMNNNFYFKNRPGNIYAIYLY